MVSPPMAKRKLALLGLAIFAFAIGYGLLLAEMFLDHVYGTDNVAAALMGGGLLASMVIVAFAMVEFGEVLGRPVRRGNEE